MQYLVKKDSLDSIANLTRDKGNTTGNLTISGVVNAIENFKGITEEIISKKVNKVVNNRITSIRRYAFQSCTSLTSVDFPNCTVIGNSVFQSCASLTTANFPECTTIGNGAFSRCKSLTAASFPKCVSIGSGAFYSCTHLFSLYLTGSTLCELSHSNAFSNTPIGGYLAAGSYGSIYVPTSLLTSYQTATNWTYFSSRFVAI